MYHAHSFFFVICLYVIFVNGTTFADRQDRRDSLFYDKSCPDGLPGRVTQIQEQFLARPAIFVTDCSPFRNNTLTDSNPFKISTFDKRQEVICFAECLNQCAVDVGPSGAPGASDCENLVKEMKDRNIQFTVPGFQTISMTYGTCVFEITNLESSPFTYCDANWAARSTGLIDSCLPRSGGMCQGSQFLAIVAASDLAPAPTTAVPEPTSSATTPNGNGANSNSTPGNTADSNTVSLPASSGARQSSASSANIPAIVGAVLGLLLLALIIIILLWRWKKRAQRQLAILEVESLPREFSTAQAIKPDSRLHAAPTLGLENGADISVSLIAVVAGGSVRATSNKARMYAEEAMPGTSDTDLSSVKPSAHTPTTDSVPTPVYQIQSSSSRRSREGSIRGHRIDVSSHGGSHDHPHLRPQQTGNALNHRGRDAYASDSYPTVTGSSSMSARTLAHLSASDIDRLAESIVVRMQGRDPAIQEGIFEEAGSSIVTEDEPPPPWSAPGVDVHGL